MTSEPQASPTFRLYEDRDLDTVLDLINADWIVGQPRVTAEMLGEALAGRSEIDSGWWAELTPPATAVACGDADRVLGVVSYARRTGENTGLLLWMHCREDSTLAAVLISYAYSQLSTAAILAFDFASALTRGLEGLPGHARPVTHQALLNTGFSDNDVWRYIHQLLPPKTDAHLVIDGITIEASADPVGEKLTYAPNGTAVGTATIGAPLENVGVLWWISIESEHRGQGHGRPLLQAALDELARLGANEVIGYVDDGTPAGRNERAAANHLYDQSGFTEIDRLHTFTHS